jgi:hypothetical protein
MPVKRNPMNESYDDYPRIVARLNDRWRVIECRDRVQWILQKHTGEDRWTGRSYCRTSEALRRCCLEERIEIDPAVLASLFELPTWLEMPARTRSKAHTGDTGGKSEPGMPSDANAPPQASPDPSPEPA